MDADSYRTFTEELRRRLAADDRVVGLVALGSMAERDYRPDEWSDHDFFVVTRPGVQEELRADLSWLPRADGVALAYRETEHGVKAVYDDGHLLELAVFDLDELRLARVNRFRVLFDRGGVEKRLAETAAPAPRDPRFHFGELLTHALVGAGRHLRGETLSGGYLVKGLAVRDLLALAAPALPAERAGLLDDLDPARRFELVHPELARELDELTRADTLDAALGLLAVAERELRPRLPELDWPALEVVRRRLRSR